MTINSPALREAAAGNSIPVNVPWLMYTMPEGKDAIIIAADDGTPLEGRPRKLAAGWYVCEIVLNWRQRRVYRVRRIRDGAVQRVVLDNPNWQDVWGKK